MRDHERHREEVAQLGAERCVGVGLAAAQVVVHVGSDGTAAETVRRRDEEVQQRHRVGPARKRHQDRFAEEFGESAREGALEGDGQGHGAPGPGADGGSNHEPRTTNHVLIFLGRRTRAGQSGADEWNRTTDTGLMRPLLYR